MKRIELEISDEVYDVAKILGRQRSVDVHDVLIWWINRGAILECPWKKLL
ncbi:MAG: hypothetical protein Q8M95_16635 [Candidatus Methanoperedens sp.]|nr:hypothetical protein [Candidatus Methanoperedens sp.]